MGMGLTEQQREVFRGKAYVFAEPNNLDAPIKVRFQQLQALQTLHVEGKGPMGSNSVSAKKLDKAWVERRHTSDEDKGSGDRILSAGYFRDLQTQQCLLTRLSQSFESDIALDRIDCNAITNW